MAEVTLTISAEDSASGVLTKVTQGLDQLSKATTAAGSAQDKLRGQSQQGTGGLTALGQSVDDISGRFRELLNPVNLFGAAIGGTLVLSLRSALDETSAYAAELRNLSLITGAPTEQLAELNQAANALGVGSGALQRALFLMSREIESGGSALARLGIPLRDNQGNLKNETTLLFQTVDALSSMSDKTRAAAVAREVFGRSAATLLPLLQAGSAQIKAFGEEAKTFGTSLDTTAAQGIKQFDIANKKLHDSLLGVKLAIAQDLIPILQPLVEGLTGAIALFQKIPQPVRTTVEILGGLAAAVIGLSSVFAALRALGAGAILANLAGSLLAIAPKILAVLAGLSNPASLVALGIAFAVGLIFDVGGIRTRLEGLASTIFETIKGVLTKGFRSLANTGLTVPIQVTPDVAGPPSSLAAKQTEPETRAELQKRVQLTQELISAQSELAKAQQGPIRGQIAALELQKQSVALKFQEQQASGLQPDQLVKAEQARDARLKALAAEQQKLRAQETVEILTQQKTILKAKQEADLGGRDLVEAQTANEIALATRTFEERKQRGLDLVTATREREKAIALAEVSSQKQLRDLDLATAKERVAILDTIRSASLTASAQEREAQLADLDRVTEAVKQQAEDFQISTADKTAFERAASTQRLSIELAGIEQEKASARAAAKDKEALLSQERLDLTGQQTARLKIEADVNKQIQDLDGKAEAARRAARAKGLEFDREDSAVLRQINIEVANSDISQRLANLERGRLAAQNNASVLRGINAREFEIRQQGFDRDVQTAINAQLKETGVFQTEAQKRLAIEAGVIEKTQQLREQTLQRTGAVLEDQARQAGDLGAAFQAGFAEAASSADDAFKAMRRSGQESFQTLKSGLSDFLFNLFTGAKNIGDTFINLGKRILRSFTDIFAEILAKQLALSAGFSLPGIIGIGTVAAGETIAPGVDTLNTEASAAAIGLETMANSSSAATQSLIGMTGVTSALLQVFTVLTAGVGRFISFLSTVLQSVGVPNSIAGGLANIVGSGGIGFGLGSLLFGKGPGGLGAGLGSALGSGAGLIFPGLGTSLLAGGTLGPAFGGGLSALLGSTLTPLLSNLVLPGIGFVIGGLLGKIFGGLFSQPDPDFRLRLGVVPSSIFNLTNAGAQGVRTPGSPFPASFGALVQPGQTARDLSGPFREQFGSQAGAVGVTLGTGRIFGGDDAARQRLEAQLAESIQRVLATVVTAAVKLSDTLPKAAAVELKAGIDKLAREGLDLGFFKVQAEDASKQLQELTKSIPLKIAQKLTDALGFGVDLASIAGGDVAKGLQDLFEALGVTSQLLKEMPGIVDAGSLSLSKFANASVDLFKRFAKDGEAFTDTVKRVGQALLGIVAFLKEIPTAIAGLSGNKAGNVSAAIAQFKAAQDQVVSLADALTIAVRSGASPDEVLKTAQEAKQALDGAVTAAKQLTEAVRALDSAVADGVKLFLSLDARIAQLGGTATSISRLVQAGTALFTGTTDLAARIAIFAAGAQAAATQVGGLAIAMPTLAAGFQILRQQIASIADPVEALAALKQLAESIQQAASAAIQAIQADFAQLRQKAQDAANVQIKALDTQKEALTKQLEAAQKWKSVLDSVQNQLKDLFLLLAPTQPLASLNKVRSQFEALFADFQKKPTAEKAEQLQSLAQQLLQLAQQTPGFDLPSKRFQDLAAEIRLVLETIVGVAKPKAGTKSIEEQLQAVEARIKAANEALQATLTSLSQQEQAAINAVRQGELAALTALRQDVAVRLQQLQAQQATAAAALQQLTGGLTFQQFIALKQGEAVDALHGIDSTLREFLGAILARIGGPVPAMAAGGVVLARPGGTLVRLGEGGQDEAVIPLTGGQSPTGRDRSGMTVTLNIQVTAGQGSDSRQLARDLDRELTSLINGPSRLKGALLDLVRRAR